MQLYPSSSPIIVCRHQATNISAAPLELLDVAAHLTRTDAQKRRRGKQLVDGMIDTLLFLLQHRGKRLSRIFQFCPLLPFPRVLRENRCRSFSGGEELNLLSDISFDFSLDSLIRPLLPREVDEIMDESVFIPRLLKKYSAMRLTPQEVEIGKLVGCLDGTAFYFAQVAAMHPKRQPAFIPLLVQVLCVVRLFVGRHHISDEDLVC